MENNDISLYLNMNLISDLKIIQILIKIKCFMEIWSKAKIIRN